MNQVTRREILRLGALTGGALLTEGILSSCSTKSKSAAAKAPTHQRGSGDATVLRVADSAAPVVDRLKVTVVVDNFYDALAKSAKIGTVDVARSGLALGPDLARQLHSEWGLGLHLESARGDETRTYLLDYGLSSTAGLENLDFLKLDVAAVDALILSHGHYDHFGGLLPLLDGHRKRMRPDLALYVGGEDTFCYRFRVPDTGDRQSYG
ncbi:MAG: MBL fold metallo-hydrolase, partial [Actinobacteria bacterium]|nr:MBL fold metallo-hydrolase [Actinomycetota bacterium]